MADQIQAYAARVKEMSPSRIVSNLKSHEVLKLSPTWERLDQGMRDDLEAMGQLLRDAGTTIELK